MKFLPRLLASLLPCFLLVHCSKGIDQSAKRAPAPAKPLLTWAELLPNKPPLPAGEAGMDLVLLRVPMATASAALLQDQGGISGAESLLQALLADGAISVVTKASVAGPEKQKLQFKDVKDFTHSAISFVSFQWRMEQTARDEGSAPPDQRELEDGKVTTPIGTKLDAVLERDGDQLQAELNFEWMPEPLKRPCNSWPVKAPGHDFTPLFQPWNFNIHYCLSDGISLLAANAEAPGPDGAFPHSGFMLMAFGKARSTPKAPVVDFTEPRKILVRTWSYEVPADKGEKLLRSRTRASNDPTLHKMLAADPAATLISCSAIASADSKPVHTTPGKPTAADPFGTSDEYDHRSLNFRSEIYSALQFEFPSEFEPTRSKEFRVVCDASATCKLPHALEIDGVLSDTGVVLDLTVSVELAATPLRWVHWYGSTLGAKDEPAGVETPVFAKDNYNASLALDRGVSQLVRARIIAGKLRMTFMDWIRRDEPESRQISQTLRIIETPLQPWLARLAQARNPALLAELEAALDSGTARLLKFELVHTKYGQRSSGVSGEGYLLSESYLNTSIRGDHLFYNPRFVSPRTAGLNAQIDSSSLGFGQIESTSILNLSEPVGTQHYALWLPHSPLQSRETSGIDRPIILRTALKVSMRQTDGGDYLLGTCLVPASTFRKEPTLRWFMMRGNASLAKSATPRPAESFIEFSVISSADAANDAIEAIHPNPSGDLLAYGAVRQTEDRSSLSSGLAWDSPEPRSMIGSDDSSHDPTTEKIPEGTKFQDQVELIATPCGFTADIEQGKWAATYQSDPRFTTDTLKTHDETPRKNPVMESNIPVSCERALYEPIATAGGSLPPLGMQITTRLGQGRLLIVRHHAGR